MLPSAFVEAANFPVRWQEKDLQNYLAEHLERRGFRVETEVRANGGRADIVTNWQGGTIIEVKKYLDRDTIYQAFGQLNLYGLNNTHKLVVMGFLTPDANAQQSAFTTASMIEQNPRTSVVFVNIDSEWLPGTSNQGRSWLPRLPKLSLPDFKNWRWWWKFFNNHPLLLVVVVSLIISMVLKIKHLVQPENFEPRVEVSEFRDPVLKRPRP
jgi:hypothetical protein